VYHDCRHVTNDDAAGGLKQQLAANLMRFLSAIVSIPELKWDGERKHHMALRSTLDNWASQCLMTKI
jgi:hypothetical protein